MTCDVCGGPVRPTAIYGICYRSAECRKERRRRAYAANPEPLRERCRSWQASNRERMSEYGRQWYAENASPAYYSWRAMRQRVLDPNSNRYQYYGGRGITVCDRWLDSFQNFLADMGQRPEATSLDRWPDPDGNYEPGNCQWSTSSQQAQHKGPMAGGASQFKGVYLDRCKWCASIKVGGKRVFLGSFDDEEDAARAYDAAASGAWGKDCYLNFHLQEALCLT